MQEKISVEHDSTLLIYLRDHLAEYPSVKAIKRAIDAKQCRINGRVEFFSTHPVKKGDVIEIKLFLKSPPQPSALLYEDEELLIVNKVAGVCSESFDEYILVHRLDKETSGAFLLAKTQRMADEIINLFAKREVEKEYYAICDGKVAKKAWVVDNYLGKKASYQGGVLFGKCSKEMGKRAVTHFASIEVGENVSFVRAKPITGRTHQIRVHLKDAGHPILGDWQYASRFNSLHQPTRLMLHCHTLSFIHPIQKKALVITAPFSPDFLETKKIHFKTY